MDSVIDIPQLDGWIPIRLYWPQGKPIVDWCYLGEQRLTNPFFSQTVEACLNRPFNLLFRHQTPIEMLGKWHQIRPGLTPNGFIFHMSRCGSTLISQMLAAVSHNIVISEAGLIDSTIRRNSRSSSGNEEQRIEWLRWVVSALGQPQRGTERHLFIKFDAWHILDLPLIRRAFPAVPWIFLYRDPVEVLTSQLGHRGAHMVPGLFEPAVFGMDHNTVITVSPEEYCARVLASLCQAGLEHHQDGGMLLNYRQLPEAVWSSLLDFFGLSCTEVELDCMRAAARRDAKNPYLPFADDTARKEQKSTAPVREAAREWLYPLYEQLEAARLGQ
jgi:gluconate kinase